MSHPITSEAALLIGRAKHLADEMASAARYGLPIPAVVSLNSYDNLEGVSFSLDSMDDFDQWAEYAEANVREYEHVARHWHYGVGDLNGLGVTFSFATPAAVTA